MPVKFQLLHISDLHIRLDQDFDRSLVLEPLLQRIEIDSGKDLAPELVLVTGDIAYSGLQAEYEEANKFFTDLLTTLKLPSERLLLVPGNHDVNRKKYRPKDIPSYHDMAELNAELENTDYRADLFKGMADYFAFVKKHYPHLTSKHDDLIPFVSSYRAGDNKNIGLVGLNSAWMCRKSPDREEVAIGEYQVNNAMNELREQGERDLDLVLFHHPLDWLWPRDREICKSTYFNDKILLTGHLHDTEGVYAMGLSGALYQFQAGGTYIGSESAWPSRYHYLTIDWDARHVRLDFRKFAKGTKRWVLDGDKGEDGVAIFPLPMPQHVKQGFRSEVAMQATSKNEQLEISEVKEESKVLSESIERVRKKFFEKIVKKISKLLGQALMAPLRTELLEQLGEGVSESAGSVARALCEQEPESAIETLYGATKECLEEEENPDDAQKIAKEVLDIFGWLILLSVSDEWVLNNKELFLRKDEMEMMTSISTDAALEVVLSRLNEQPAKFPFESIDSDDIDIKGRNYIDCLLPETGFSLEYRVMQFIKKIYTVVYRKTPGDNVSSDDVIRELNKYMSLSRKHKKQIYYVTIPREEGIECHEEVQAICRELRARLSALLFVHIGVRGGDEILLIYEYDLRALIRMFLELIKEYI